MHTSYFSLSQVERPRHKAPAESLHFSHNLCVDTDCDSIQHVITSSTINNCSLLNAEHASEVC